MAVPIKAPMRRHSRGQSRRTHNGSGGGGGGGGGGREQQRREGRDSIGDLVKHGGKDL